MPCRPASINRECDVSVCNFWNLEQFAFTAFAYEEEGWALLADVAQTYWGSIIDRGVPPDPRVAGWSDPMIVDAYFRGYEADVLKVRIEHIHYVRDEIEDALAYGLMTAE
jgi:hypothetical protein